MGLGSVPGDDGHRRILAVLDRKGLTLPPSMPPECKERRQERSGANGCGVRWVTPGVGHSAGTRADARASPVRRNRIFAWRFSHWNVRTRLFHSLVCLKQPRTGLGRMRASCGLRLSASTAQRHRVRVIGC